MPHKGRLVSRFGAEMLIENQEGELQRCTGRKKVASAVCGDYVEWEDTDQGNNIVTRILPRRNLLKRPAPSGREKLIAANIDQILIVLAYSMKPNWDMLDHYLVAAHSLHTTPFILCNKLDLAGPDKDKYDRVLDEYRQLGYRVQGLSAHKLQGIEALLAELAGKTNILVGQSGVGKSSIIMALHPQINIRIGEVSQHSGEGQHTTSATTLYHLPGGGELIDSPGVRDFRPGKLSQDDIEHGFPEFIPFLGQCRFHNCTHSNEPGCAIKGHVSSGEILKRRYQSYLRMLSEPAE
jgi:ribosome biogenesis GTPase / thiamine phosphate phosphatase